ncbi:DUF2628 domain-containing protein [Sphingosinicella sp. CPCC 101087]|uniref:DUF2628 domain-containing protein n=1 Tax=Sphingosinicella sp. CPCC 101087 TaxID=2497754 RepID=UPI00101D5159|nr:DUF2628 domain-containing protein [Sphingosinicella sp. CPCC 101087]
MTGKVAPAEEERQRAAIGRNAEYYLGRWREMEAKSSAISWNWPACLVNLFWFAYRKMWLPMAATLLALVALSLVGAAVGSGQIAFLLTIGLSFVTGGFGNFLYRRRISRLVADTSALPIAAQLEALRSRGGVSITAAAILLLLFGSLALMAVASAVSEQSRLEKTNEPA